LESKDTFPVPPQGKRTTSSIKCNPTAASKDAVLVLWVVCFGVGLLGFFYNTDLAGKRNVFYEHWNEDAYTEY